MTTDHKCKDFRTCTCSIYRYGPDETCPIHGVEPWRKRCSICGRFMSWDVRIEKLDVETKEHHD